MSICEASFQASAVAGYLAQNATLRVLSLRGSALGAEGAALLAAGLACNSTLASLDLGATDLRREGLEALAPALAKGRALRELRLDDNALGAGAAAVLPTTVAPEMDSA